MNGREVRLLATLTGQRGGWRGRGGNVCRLQARRVSTEPVEAPAAAPVSYKSASAGSTRVVQWSPTRPNLLRRASPRRTLTGEGRQEKKEVKRFYIDTHSMVKSLEEGGYSSQQAESLVSLLSHSLGNSLEPLLGSSVSQKDLELLEVRVAGEVDSVRAHLVLLERSTVDTLRGENESLNVQIKKLREVLQEEVRKVHSGVQLDLNLEKSRLKEESTKLEQQIKDTNNRIQTEVAQLKTQIESQKLESIKYLAGGIFSVVTIVLSVMLGLSRLIK